MRDRVDRRAASARPRSSTGRPNERPESSRICDSCRLRCHHVTRRRHPDCDVVRAGQSEPLAELCRIGGGCEHVSGSLSPAVQTAVGETPARFVERLRTEQAAFRLLVTSDSILKIALDCGYANHETLTRAFKRRFRTTPRDYKIAGRLRRRTTPARGDPEVQLTGHELSQPRLVRLRPLPIAYIRHVGPYERVPESLWSTLQARCAETLGHQGGLLIGIGHDSPSITPGDKLRFDACLVLDGPHQKHRDIHYGELPKLNCAVTTYVGPYALLPEIYPTVFRQISNMGTCKVIGLPVIEIYRDNTVELTRSASVTEIHIPVEVRQAEGGVDAPIR